MATEKRQDLINRQDLIKAVESKHFAISDNTHPYEAIRIQGKYFREVVDNAPKVDAVEVVRCKDCKHNEDCIRRIQFWGRNPVLELNTTEYHPIEFCSYGERKDNG